MALCTNDLILGCGRMRKLLTFAWSLAPVWEVSMQIRIPGSQSVGFLLGHFQAVKSQQLSTFIIFHPSASSASSLGNPAKPAKTNQNLFLQLIRCPANRQFHHNFNIMFIYFHHDFHIFSYFHHDFHHHFFSSFMLFLIKGSHQDSGSQLASSGSSAWCACPRRLDFLDPWWPQL